MALNSHVGYGGVRMNNFISTNVDLGDQTAFSPHQEKVLILGAVKDYCGAAAFGREHYYQSGFFGPTSGSCNLVFGLEHNLGSDKHIMRIFNCNFCTYKKAKLIHLRRDFTSIFTSILPL